MTHCNFEFILCKIQEENTDIAIAMASISNANLVTIKQNKCVIKWSMSYETNDDRINKKGSG